MFVIWPLVNVYANFIPFFIFSLRCQCTAGYTGKLCDYQYFPCESNPCLNGGMCKQVSASSYQCICSSGKLFLCAYDLNLQDLFYNSKLKHSFLRFYW